MNGHLIDLAWLPKPPLDFLGEVRRRTGLFSEARAGLQRLAECQLTNPQLHTLGSAIGEVTAADPEAIRIGILSNGTSDLLAPALTATALRHGVWAHVTATPFDQIGPEALTPTSTINKTQCHFVLLALDHRGLPLRATPGAEARAKDQVSEAIAYTEAICHALHNSSQCTVILQTVPQVGDRLFGSLERRVPGTLSWQIDHYNRELVKRISNSSDLLLDVAALAETVGLSHWHDPAAWALGKFPFAMDILPLYSDWIGRLIAAARGKMRRCLVLDLDNTVWGGVIGDDGLGGIVLGNGTPEGESFLQVQRTALELRDRGVLLAVCSKNAESVAREPFRSHPEMLLRERHISVFQANWYDKASNLKLIAEALNIGLDSLVLLDDNAAERAQVRGALPMVAVPELPEDPSGYSPILLASGYFEAVNFTAEDQRRAEFYEANAARTKALSASTDLGSYLLSLEMKATFRSFDAIDRARITQLINKSNQFNLTTRRYSEEEVQRLESKESGLTLQVRLIDRFGDNGIVGIVICYREESAWIIDTWLMSCRVLNRELERATLNHIVRCAKSRGIRTLLGHYIRTSRNELVKDHYKKLEFTVIRSEEQESHWSLDVMSYVEKFVPIETI